MSLRTMKEAAEAASAESAERRRLEAKAELEASMKKRSESEGAAPETNTLPPLVGGVFYRGGAAGNAVLRFDPRDDADAVAQLTAHARAYGREVIAGLNADAPTHRFLPDGTVAKIDAVADRKAERARLAEWFAGQRGSLVFGMGGERNK